jgi:hypothetical protein
LIIQSFRDRSTSSDEWISKEDLLDLIAECQLVAITAIHAWPQNVVEIYEQGAEDFRIRMAGGKAGPPIETPPWLTKAGLSLDDFSNLNFYLFTTSFISAWYHLARDKAKRDQLAQSACLMIGGLGLDPTQAMGLYIRFELDWRRAFVANGLFFPTRLRHVARAFRRFRFCRCLRSGGQNSGAPISGSARSHPRDHRGPGAGATEDGRHRAVIPDQRATTRGIMRTVRAHIGPLQTRRPHE